MAERVRGLILDRGDLVVIGQLIHLAERQRKQAGLTGAWPRVERLKMQVQAALADNRTPNGQRNKANGHRWIGTAEYSRRMGVSPRTARRHAVRGGIRQGGRWYIKIIEPEEID